MTLPLIVLKNVGKSYASNKGKDFALKNINLYIHPADTIAITGASGSGKSTLLNILGLLDTSSEGEYFLAGCKTSTASNHEICLLRNQHIGFIFQNFHLLPHMSVQDNVALPLRYRGLSPYECRRIAREYLNFVGMDAFYNQCPSKLSGGQRQRVAIARALTTCPKLILADEPTGSLDPATANEIIELLLTMNKTYQITLIIVTHDPHVAARMARKITVNQGLLQEQE